MTEFPDKQSIIIGSDHAAFDMKEKLKAFLASMGFAVTDAGTHSTASVDYVDIGAHVALEVSSGRFKRGILLCGTGIGMSMTANRVSGVRAALCNDLFGAIMSRKHNNANILVMGGRVLGDVLAEEITRTWLETPFEGGRHQRRIEKIEAINASKR
jgi:ribose 5-phosphate isomerase B